MPAVTLVVEDLAGFVEDPDEARAEKLIAGALGMARAAAPCIFAGDFEHPEAAQAILLGAVARWYDSGSGALQSTSESAGPFSHQQTFDTRSPQRNLLWPTEIRALQGLCGGARRGRISFVDSAPSAGSAVHPLFGALVNGPFGWAPGEWP